MTNKQVLTNAINKYGERHQLIKLIEECSELINEICDCLDGDDNRDKIIEETADVMITIEQLMMIKNITEDEIFVAKHKKLRRLENNLSE